MIYFDNNATTQIAPEVLGAVGAVLEGGYGNPSSAHALGREAARIVGEARRSVADLLGAADAEEVVFTSGGTESDNWAILGALDAQPGKDHIITTRVEHEAVRKTCQSLEAKGYRVTWIDVDGDGALDLDSLRDALDERTGLVSAMMANNETGVVFPIAEIGEIVKENSTALFHVDGVNAVGKILIDLKATRVDLFSLSGHKFHAPKGVGALYIRNGVELPAMFIGGRQEMGRRAGTPAVHQIAGLGAAAAFVKDTSGCDGIREMRDRLENKLLADIPDTYINGDRDKRLPNTASISFENTNGEMIMARLDDAGVCVSTGSACHSQDHKASSVLEAMDVPYSRAMGAIRFSLGRFNKMAEVDQVVDLLPAIISDLRRIGGNYETKTV